MQDQGLTKMAQERHFSLTQNIIKHIVHVRRQTLSEHQKGENFTLHKQDQNTCFSRKNRNFSKVVTWNSWPW